jgi:long-subunit acyl-CoA synthetase (AMP-forming)
MRALFRQFSDHAAQAPDHPAIDGYFGRVSYHDLCLDVRRTARWAQTLPPVVGLMAPKDCRWIVWFLALAWAGRTVVPMPEFFSSEQLAGVVADSGLDGIVTTPGMLTKARALGVAAFAPLPSQVLESDPSSSARLIVYTSGTAGRPKGVVLGGETLAHGVQSLVTAIGMNARDRALSVLSPALLLEQVASILAPLWAGGTIILGRDSKSVPMDAEAFRPTTCILPPELLSIWVGWLESWGKRAPESLRFMTVGGAPVPPVLAERAWRVGLPVHESYGLSECCSLVAMNRPGERVPGTVGTPLDGVQVVIDGGEIVVSGPTVMEGYLHGERAQGRHYTGDAGYFDQNGRLGESGRIDDVIVTGEGRNIHPESIEAMVMGDPRIAQCAVVDGGELPVAVVVPAKTGFKRSIRSTLDAHVAGLCAAAPDYAVPVRTVVVEERELKRRNLVTSNGRLRRRAIAQYLREADDPL